ncbi:uncharacterized protein EAE97_006441 [Botrytis byssoidea]|uniref:Uncharacterized protein n=1 Tax=Botrytis byssoidea TaxID=139641 RepID=A0A9P5INH3_9HELO|nr:uncharacterized protein EAE97_006441 [Botrytis byssoidea]KAF7941604.1 hypothetical protein EAE97_006441 [Botrytis byssoidea]
MFSKTLIATILASTVAASPIAASTASTTYTLRTFPLGAGSIFRGLEISAVDGWLWVGKSAPAIQFSFDNGHVNIQGGQELYLLDSSVVYAAPDASNPYDAGWVFEAPHSGPNSTLGGLTYPGFNFWACTTSEANVYAIAVFPTYDRTYPVGCEEIQLITQ